jgi:cell wall-associated NlpC family hydrolase
MIPGAKQIPLSDNPPGYTPVGPGAQRDQNWMDYLNGKNADGSIRPPRSAPAALPKPEAVQDKGLRAIGAAGRQQGISYAWGANQSVDGPTHGTLEGDPPGGDAHLNHDETRTGYDCGGLVRFSMSQATGEDPFEHTGPQGAGTDLLDTSKYLAPVKGGMPGADASQYAQPGDVLVFGNAGHEAFSGSGTHHTGIYLGNGVIIDAPESGLPVRVDSLRQWDGDPTDILRPTP